jgi:mannose-6-phosphate isomerase-like protein (cupin superfamily)
MKRKVVNPFIKDEVTFLHTTSETGGHFTELEILLMPGGKNPLHFHRTYSEKFTVVSGQLGVYIGKNKKKILNPGETYTVQPMQLHCFFNPGNTPIKFNVQIAPGHAGFEKTICIAYGLAADNFASKKSRPINLKQTALLLFMGDMGIPGIFSLFTPIFKLLAKRAIKSGEEKRLIEKYCN